MGSMIGFAAIASVDVNKFIDEMFLIADTNKNGLVSFDEFAEFLKKKKYNQN